MLKNLSFKPARSLTKKISFLMLILIGVFIHHMQAHAQETQVLTPFDHAGLAVGDSSLYIMPAAPSQQSAAVPSQQTLPTTQGISEQALRAPVSERPALVGTTAKQPAAPQTAANIAATAANQGSAEPKMFGYDMFEKSAGLGVGDIVITDGYRVGPGDVFQIMVWGSEEASFTAQITSTGELMMPKYGSAPVAGLSFAEMKMAVNDIIGSRLTGFEMSVVPIRPRRNSVFVVGEVVNPGAYELDGTGTALSALFMCGGPTPQGSMRKIEVRRGKKVVGVFDVYDFLTRGDRSGDVDLQEGDTVFVPMAGPRVFVNGAVRRPAIYELKPDEMTIGAALTLAGGITQVADLKKIQVRRLQPHSGQIVFSREISRNDGKFEGNATPVQDLDTIMVFAISPRNLEMISLEGHVFEPGVRPWRPGLKLSDIIQSAGQFKREPALEYGEILREGGAGGEYEVISFNPGRVLGKDASADVELHPKDRVVIFPASLMRDQAKVSINGHVVNPGNVGYTSGMRVKDLVYRSGGLKQGASLVAAELSRRTIIDGRLTLDRLEIDLGKAMRDDPLQNITLQPFDSLMIRSVPDWQIDSYISLAGEFKYPGRYSFQPGEKLSAVIKRAGGYGDKAYLKAAIFTRAAVKKAQADARGKRFAQIRQEQVMTANDAAYMVGSYPSEKSARDYAVQQYNDLIAILEKTQPEGRVIVQLDELEKMTDSKYDVVLEPGDELYLPQRPSSVMVEGAVYNSMGVLWEMNRSIRHYLNVAGGVSKTGDQGSTYLIRADGTVISRRSGGGDFIDRTIVEPGDIILVPTKIRVPVDRWQRNLDVVKILSNLALTGLAIDRYRR